MRRILMLLSWAAIVFPAAAQHRIIVCIGSSTTAGQGATPNPNPIDPYDPPDSCWASILKRYYKDLGLIDTLVNLGESLLTTYDGMPTGTPYPNGGTVNNQQNVTAALTRYNADIVIVNYPTNDVTNGYTADQTLANLQVIYNTVVNAGKICYITTTQPRNTRTNDSTRRLLKTERDMILNQFGTHAINFYNGIVGADSLTINPVYNYDGTHVNNAGHRVLFGAARDANILAIAPLPIILTGFTAVKQQDRVLLSWTSTGQTGPASFIVERSGNGAAFEDLAEISASDNALPGSSNAEPGSSNPLPGSDNGVSANSGATGQRYSWADEHPLAGKNYYRIKTAEHGGADHFSGIVSITNTPATWQIGKLYQASGAIWNIELLTERNTRLQLRIVDAEGRHLIKRSLSVDPPSLLIPLNLSGLPAGQYFVQVVSDHGEPAVRTIQKQ